MRDPARTVPRDAPFVIWHDPVAIEWSDDERALLEQSETGRQYLGTLPSGVHCRPVDLTHGDEVYAIWTFETERRPYVWPPKFDARYADVVLRGSLPPDRARGFGRARADAEMDQDRPRCSRGRWDRRRVAVFNVEQVPCFSHSVLRS